MAETKAIIDYLELKQEDLLKGIKEMPNVKELQDNLNYIRNCIEQLSMDESNKRRIYHNKTLDKVREDLEREFREQYDISCENSYLKWQGKFKQAFENVCEALYQLDQLIK